MTMIALILVHMAGILFWAPAGPGLQKQESERLAGKVRVTLVADRTSYLKGEMIFMEALVRNLTTQPVQVPVIQQALHYLEVRVQDEKGKLVPPLSHGHPILPVFKDTLLPSEEKRCRILLLQYGNAGSWTCSQADLLPGEYKVWVELNDVRSNVIALKILEPTGRHRVVYEKLQDLELRSERISIKDRTQILKDLLLSYRGTAYEHNIYLSLLVQYWQNPETHDQREMIRIALEYFDRYPDYLGLKSEVMYYRFALERTQGVARDFAPSPRQAQAIEKQLLQLKEKYPGKRIARFVDEELAKAKKEWSQRKR